tara:strand:+ start:9621 stop:10241 length:621 start_codon:yes stop_codon:yes gene_type:complete
MNKIIGCILTGGKASRMGGKIKCLETINNKKILDIIIERSKEQVADLIINANCDKKKFNKYKLPIFSDVLKGYLGPLAGIHASLSWVKKNKPNYSWIFTFAGDSPFFPSNIVKKIHEKAIKKDKKIIIAKSFGRDHPVFGLWHLSLLEELENAIINENIRKIDKWAQKYHYETVSFDDANYDQFFNINVDKDLIIAEKIENQFFNK